MIVRTPTPGWDAQVFAAASGPPEDLSEWGEPVGRPSTPARPWKSTSTVAKPARYFLLWFNKASEARDQDGRYQVEISDIKLLDEADRIPSTSLHVRTRPDRRRRPGPWLAWRGSWPRGDLLARTRDTYLFI